MKPFFAIILLFGISACNSNSNEQTYPEVQATGAMKNVMWNGELDGIIRLDTIENKADLYGLGPQSHLSGELLINNGQAFLSKVLSDSTMEVTKTFDVSAPFFVHTNVNKWNMIELPINIKTIKQLERYIDEQTKHMKRPFAFKLIGSVASATIHIQNLPEGSKVSSPAEAHIGQTNYSLQHEDVEIIGFFSTEHAGVFTHHDSYLHMHLITKDETKMGHLDKVELDGVTLFLPKK